MTDLRHALTLLTDKIDDIECIIEAAQKTFLLSERLERGEEVKEEDFENDLLACPHIPLHKIVEIFESDIIRAALHATNWNISAAAELLGEPRSSISIRCKVWKLGIPDPDSKARLRLEIGRFLRKICEGEISTER